MVKLPEVLLANIFTYVSSDTAKPMQDIIENIHIFKKLLINAKRKVIKLLDVSLLSVICHFTNFH